MILVMLLHVLHVVKMIKTVKCLLVFATHDFQLVTRV